MGQTQDMTQYMDQNIEVACPICQVRLPQGMINSHIDSEHAEDAFPWTPVAKRRRTSQAAVVDSSTARSSTMPAPIATQSVDGGIIEDNASVTSVPQSGVSPSTRPQCLPMDDVDLFAIDEPTPAAPVQESTPRHQDFFAEAHNILNAEPALQEPVQKPDAGQQSPMKEEKQEIHDAGTSSTSAAADVGAPAERGGSGSSGHMQVLTASASGDTVATQEVEGSRHSSPSYLSLQPEEHLKAHLIGSRTHAVHHVQDLSKRSHAKVFQLCRKVDNEIQGKWQELEEYPVAAKPADYHQQCARNEVRRDLEQLVRMTQDNLNSIHTALHEPEDALRREKFAQLKQIDATMRMLEVLRTETLSHFEDIELEEKRACEKSEAAALSLGSSLERVGNFVRHLAQEVDDETEKAIQVHTEKLHELQQEQLRFVKANDSPQRNPIFAKVIDDIASTERLLQEHHGQGEAYKSLLGDWEEVATKMPAQTPAPSNSKKHWLWSRMFSHS